MKKNIANATDTIKKNIHKLLNKSPEHKDDLTAQMALDSTTKKSTEKNGTVIESTSKHMNLTFSGASNEVNEQLKNAIGAISLTSLNGSLSGSTLGGDSSGGGMHNSNSGSSGFLHSPTSRTKSNSSPLFMGEDEKLHTFSRRGSSPVPIINEEESAQLTGKKSDIYSRRGSSHTHVIGEENSINLTDKEDSIKPTGEASDPFGDDTLD